MPRYFPHSRIFILFTFTPIARKRRITSALSRTPKSTNVVVGMLRTMPVAVLTTTNSFNSGGRHATKSAAAKPRSSAHTQR
eukprot:4151949-Alexandrium_andersonii.AAC.1